MERIEINSGNLRESINRIAQSTGYSEIELTEKAGIGRNTIYNWRTGKSAPQIEILLFFLDAAGFRLIAEKKKKDRA